MSRSRGSDRPTAHGSSGRPCTTPSCGLGVQVELMTPQQGLPDLVFTANAGLVFGNALLQLALSPRGARPRDAASSTPGSPSTASRSSTCPKACTSRGPATRCSAADAFRRLPHPQRRARPSVARPGAAACRCCRWNWSTRYFYHLDTCFCPLAPGEAIYYPGAFDAYGRKVLQDAYPTLIAVEEDGGGPLRLQRGRGRQDGRHQHRLPKLAEELAAAGYTPIAVELDEFIKAGGSASA